MGRGKQEQIAVGSALPICRSSQNWNKCFQCSEQSQAAVLSSRTASVGSDTPAALKQAGIIDIAGMVSKGSTMAYRQLVTTKGCSEQYLVAVGAVGTTGVALTGPAAPATRHVPVPSCTLVTVGAHHIGQAGAAPRLIIAGHILPCSQYVAGAS